MQGAARMFAGRRGHGMVDGTGAAPSMRRPVATAGRVGVLSERRRGRTPRGGPTPAAGPRRGPPAPRERPATGPGDDNDRSAGGQR